MTARRRRQGPPLFQRPVNWSGRAHGSNWFTNPDAWWPDVPQLLIERDVERGGWYATRWSRTKQSWVPVPGSRRSTLHDCALAAWASIGHAEAGRIARLNGIVQ